MEMALKMTGSEKICEGKARQDKAKALA